MSNRCNWFSSWLLLTIRWWELQGYGLKICDSATKIAATTTTNIVLLMLIWGGRGSTATSRLSGVSWQGQFVGEFFRPTKIQFFSAARDYSHDKVGWRRSIGAEVAAVVLAKLYVGGLLMLLILLHELQQCLLHRWLKLLRLWQHLLLLRLENWARQHLVVLLKHHQLG